MVRKKYKHNTKSLRRYKKNELKKFVKENELPLKITSKMTKNEIVASLLKLQRAGYEKCMCKLELKGPRKLSEKQQLNIRKFQERNSKKFQKIKETVTETQKIDKVKEPQPQPIRVDERPTPLERIKSEPLMLEGVGFEGLGIDSLDNLFDIANKTDQQTMTENLAFIEKEIFGQVDEMVDNVLDETTSFFEKEFESLEEQKEETPQEPVENDKQFRDRVKGLTNDELKVVMKEQGVKKRSQYKTKNEMVNAIINEVPRDKIEEYLI